MPKAKPSQVIVHRIELQQSERDAMEAALAGRFLTNAVGSLGSVLSGFGTFLAPFSGAIAAIATAMIAEKGMKAIIEEGKEKKELWDDMYGKDGSLVTGTSLYTEFVAWITAAYETTGYKYLDKKQRSQHGKALADQLDYLQETYGVFDVGTLVKALDISVLRAQEPDSSRTLVEWFTYEMPSDKWAAWHTAWLRKQA